MAPINCSARAGKPRRRAPVRGAVVALLAIAASGFLSAPASATERRPADIVDARTIIPDLVVDMRYLTARNFVGRPIAGYRSGVCLLTKRAATALGRVADELKPRGLGLKVYDCYRPQRAVDEFVAWGGDLGDQRMKSDFYPGVDKRSLFRDGYIASVDDPVTRYIPDLKGSAYEGVTLRQLLTMSSGVKWNEDWHDQRWLVVKRLDQLRVNRWVNQRHKVH